MHDLSREGTPEMFVCDFCAQRWRDDRPMIEGHKGSLVCAPCLSIAYRAVVFGQGETAPPKSRECTLCLERRDQALWVSPARPEAAICLRCVKQAATRLEKDEDLDWTRPAAPGGAPD